MDLNRLEVAGHDCGRSLAHFLLIVLNDSFGKSHVPLRAKGVQIFTNKVLKRAVGGSDGPHNLFLYTCEIKMTTRGET